MPNNGVKRKQKYIYISEKGQAKIQNMYKKDTENLEEKKQRERREREERETERKSDSHSHAVPVLFLTYTPPPSTVQLTPHYFLPFLSFLSY